MRGDSYAYFVIIITGLFSVSCCNDEWYSNKVISLLCVIKITINRFENRIIICTFDTICCIIFVPVLLIVQNGS